MHTYLSRSLAYDAFLRTTGLKIGLITDREQFVFIENTLLGGYAGVNTRHVTVNSPHEHILYVDENNQYG